MYLVAGLGVTGQSVLRYFASQGEACYALDTREEFDVSALQASFPDVTFATGKLPKEWCPEIDTIVLSPGIAKSEPWVKTCLQEGKNVIGDIELFARATGQPIVAITGSNGKSTVSTLVAQALSESGLRVGLGGNIGKPALDLLLDEDDFEVFVLELSSFQLETTYSLQATASTVLNISEDHMDRYVGLEDYIQAKMTILNNTELAVLPMDFHALKMAKPKHEARFSLRRAAQLARCEFGLIIQDGQVWLGRGDHAFLPVSSMAQQGEHHQLNALAMIALCQPFEVADAVFEKVLSQFTGLPHRTQLVLEQADVKWINDSKGTNVGATVTAIETLGKGQAEKNVILLAGGVGKEADFTDLGEAVAQYCKYTILFGQDQQQMAQACLADSPVSQVETLEDAILEAKRLAKAGDTVLFSPACASFDQFKNYEARGLAFENWVRQHIAESADASITLSEMDASA